MVRRKDPCPCGSGRRYKHCHGQIALKRKIVTSLDGNEVKNLSLSSLVQRMDDIRVEIGVERHGIDFFTLRGETNPFPIPKVACLMATLSVQNKDENQQRRIADAAFRFLLQLDMLSVSSGISNKIVYGPDYKEENWKKPLQWIRASVIDQYQIVASRIALECFFDLIYILHKGVRMPGRSKFSSFRAWVCEPENPYKYFVGHIINAFYFNRNHRQKEVHGTSRFAQCLLRLQVPDSNERNISLELTNVLIDVWRPLVKILNGKRPSSISVFSSCDDFASKYFETLKDPEAKTFDNFVQDLLARHMN